MALCALPALGACAATAAASPSEQMIFDAPHELVEGKHGDRGRTLDELQSLGADTVRVLMYWRAVAPHPDWETQPGGRFDPSDPATYPAESWSSYDAVISGAKERGMTVLLTPTGPIPRWASASNSGTEDPRPEAFAAFMHAVGTRYSGGYRAPFMSLPGLPFGPPLPDVDEWSIWNEPNVPYFLGPQLKDGVPYSPRLYRRLYEAGHAALEATGNGGDPILIGETGSRGSARGVAPLRFLRGVLCLSADYRRDPRCAPLPADGWATHPYTQRIFPTAGPRVRDDVTIGSLDRLASALDRAGAAGALSPRLPIYVTEFGVQSLPDPWVGLGLRRQAEYRSLAESLAWHNPRVRSFAQYLMRDDPPALTRVRYGGFESGLRTASGQRKPSYAGFRLPLVVARRGSGVVIWGLVRPASDGDRVRIEARDRFGRPWTVARAPTRRSAFRAGGGWAPGRSWRTVWTSPAGVSYRGPWVRAYRL